VCHPISFVIPARNAAGLICRRINLTEMNDRTLKKAMNWVPEDSVVLFEDIDCMRAGHRRQSAVAEEKPQLPTITAQNDAVSAMLGVTLSGLLNVLDGFHAPENVIFVMTTNDVDALDPALLRSGRIDYKLFMGRATESQKAELYLRFFPEASEAAALEFAREHRAETMAEFQGLLLALEHEFAELESILVRGRG
jgi:chaperone BCS1